MGGGGLGGVSTRADLMPDEGAWHVLIWLASGENLPKCDAKGKAATMGGM